MDVHLEMFLLKRLLLPGFLRRVFALSVIHFLRVQLEPLNLYMEPTILKLLTIPTLIF